MPKAVEGQDIALDILGGEPERGWSAFQERYGNLLSKQAEAILRWAPTLRSFGQSEDLVQGFLAEQVIGRRDVMLTPAARGEQPLWPRLSRSFTNYCNQILRRLARQPRLVSEDAAEPEAVTDFGDAGDRDDVWTSIERRVRERQNAIRLAFSEQEPGMVPLLHLLLLSERLFLAQLMETRFAEADLRPSPEVPIPELVSRIAPWSNEEQGQGLPPRNLPLEKAWDSLTKPVLRSDGDSIAQVLGSRRDRWDQWIRRARVRVVTHNGPDASRVLFPHWPERLTANLVGPRNVRGGS